MNKLAKAYVKCLYCGETFDRNAVPTTQVNARRYAHTSCWEEHEKNMTQEERDMEAFYAYTKGLFKDQYNYLLTKKLAEKYIKENNYTYSGMLKSLQWFYETEGNSIEKSNGTIGIIPYVYNDALNHYYNLYKANNANKEKNLINYLNQINTKEFIISSPKTTAKMPKLWFEGD